MLFLEAWHTGLLVNYTQLGTSRPVVSCQYSPADVRIFQHSSEIVLEILQNKKMTEAMMTETHVQTSAEEERITLPSKMDKNVLLSKSQNWYVGVVLGGKYTEIHFHLFDYVGLVSSYGRLDAPAIPSTLANRDTHASACESRRLLSRATHALTKRYSSLLHVLITDSLALQHRKQWDLYEVVCNRHQRIVVTYTRKKHVLTNHVYHSWSDCWNCLLAGGKACVYYNCLLWCLYPQSPLARLSPRETN